MKKIKVDIWSDVRCPFCYIGKRRYEAGLAAFEGRDDVETEWHSFELDPGMERQHGLTSHEYLAARKGRDLEWAQKAHEHVTAMAAEVGLDYRFDKAIVAPSFDAHRLAQLAKRHGLGEAAEERLFKAYFTDGLDTGDHETLFRLGTEIGIPAAEVSSMLASDAYADEVRRDEMIAEQIGVTGVPFFVIDSRYAISGAQEPSTFLAALRKVREEHAIA